MPFHRFKDPAYFEAPAFPGTIDGITYDRINVTDEGVGAGGSAIVDGIAGPLTQNPNTHFVAFTEEGRSDIVNRGLRALAEGADHMDDLVHRDLATPTVRAAVTPGADVSSFVITGEVFVGTGADTAENRNGLIQLVGSNSQPLNALIAGSFQAIKVTSITGIGGGYQTNPTIGVSPDIPSGVQYRAVFYARKSPASQGQAMLVDLAKVDGNWEAELNALAKNMSTQDFVFTGQKTFQDPTTFNATASLEPPSEGAALLDSQGGATVDSRVLLFEFLSDVSTGIKTRLYMQGDGPGPNLEPGFLVTTNARWVETGADWVPDDTTVQARRTAFTGEGIFVNRRVAALPASWGDTNWDDDEGELQLGPRRIVADYRDIDNPVIRVNRVSGDDPTDPLAEWKLIFQFATGDGVIKTRIFSGDDGGGDGHFAITVNASYDPTSLRWTADNDAEPAIQLTAGLDTGPDSSEFHVHGKEVTVSPWLGWDTGPITAGAEVGNMRVSGLFKYSNGRQHKTMLDIHKGVQLQQSGGTIVAMETNSPGPPIGITILDADTVYVIPIELPQGAELTRVRAVTFQHAANFGSRLEVFKTAADFAGPSAPVGAQLGVTSTAPASASIEVLDSTAFSEFIDNTTTRYSLEYRARDTTPGATLCAVEITWIDFGVRND